MTKWALATRGGRDTPTRVTGWHRPRPYRRCVHQIAAPVACVLAGLWLAYLVPYKLRHRQQLLESRVDDRYSEALRVVAVTRRAPKAGTGPRGGRTVRQVGPAHAGTTGLLTPGRGLVATATGGTGGETVDRPHATPERITAEAARRAAQARAARAAASARRAAAARRRALLAVVLLVAAVGGWTAVGLVPAASIAFGLAPTALLALVLVAGRRAVVAGKRNDEAIARQIHEADELATKPRTGVIRVAAPAATATDATPVAPADAAVPTTPAITAPVRASVKGKASQTPSRFATESHSTPVPKVTGRAVRPSEANTEVFQAIVADRGEKGTTARHTTGAVPVVPAASSSAASDEADEHDGWAPVPVPRPTYAMKPAAPHREPIPLGEVEGSTTARAAAAPAEPVADDELVTPQPPAEASASIDLNAVLAKRRAAGE